jgi:hypothetical protein
VWDYNFLYTKGTQISVLKVKRKSYPCNRPWRPIELWDAEAPTFSRQSAHRRRWGCQPYAPAGRRLPPGRFLVLISVDHGPIVRLEGLGKLKNPMTSGIKPTVLLSVDSAHINWARCFWLCGLQHSASNRFVSQLEWGQAPEMLTVTTANKISVWKRSAEFSARGGSHDLKSLSPTLGRGII